MRGLFFALIGGMFFAIGVLMTLETRKFRRDGRRVAATVTKVDRRIDSDGDVTYQPFFSFTTLGGDRLERPSFLRSTSYNFPVDSVHDVFAVPDGDRVMMADGWAPVIFRLALLGLGGGATVAGLSEVLAYLLN